MKNLTPWFDGKIYKPVRQGVYQGRFFSAIGFRHWDGETWGNWFCDYADAAERKHRPAIYLRQTDDWRGIYKPEPPIEAFLERMGKHLRKEVKGAEMGLYRNAPMMRACLWNSLSKQAEHIYLYRYEKETK